MDGVVSTSAGAGVQRALGEEETCCFGVDARVEEGLEMRGGVLRDGEVVELACKRVHGGRALLVADARRLRQGGGDADDEERPHVAGVVLLLLQDGAYSVVLR